DAPRARPLRQRGGELRGGQAAIASEEDRRELGPGRERGADPACEIRIELIGHDATDVVRLEDPVEVPDGHGAASYRSPASGRSGCRGAGYRLTTRSMTDVSGTCSPSWNHHLASQRWHVEKDRSRSPTVIEIAMRSPCLQVGQVPLVSRIGEVSAVDRRGNIAQCRHLEPGPQRLRTLPVRTGTAPFGGHGDATSARGRQRG